MKALCVVAFAAATTLTFACGRTLPTAPGEVMASPASGSQPSAVAETAGNPDLEARGIDCTPTFSHPSNSVRVGLAGRTFDLRVNFRAASNPGLCQWRFENLDHHQLISYAGSAYLTSARGAGDATFSIRVLRSQELLADMDVQTVVTTFRLTAAGKNYAWLLRVDRYCPTLGWCR